MRLPCRFLLLAILFLLSVSIPVSAKQKSYSIGDMIPDRLYEFFPKDLAQLLDKKRVCVHFGGEVGGPMDAARIKSIQQAMKGCDKMESRQKQLETKYASHPIFADLKVTLAEIDRGEDLDYAFIWKDPENKSKALKKYIEVQAESTLKNVPELLKDYDTELGKSSPSLGFIPLQLNVQWESLQLVLREKSRLQPALRARIEALSKDQVFAERAEKYRATLK
jgi:hypothetical protein